MNISSNETGLGAALTNPTELARRKGHLKHAYPVVLNGVTYADAEAAYKFAARMVRTRAKRPGTLAELTPLMTQVLIAKLGQHPILMRHIAKEGGRPFLMSCSHILNVNAPVEARGRWEGVGMDSPFIACLVDAHDTVLAAIERANTHAQQEVP